MIKYRLACNDCELSFDSWFASSKEFEKLKKKKLLICYNCNSLKVDKTLMAPTLINNKKNLNNSMELTKYVNVKKTIINYEARSIHYDKKKKSKGIYGNASKKDLNELKEEGIDTQMIPWIEDKDN